MIYEDGRRMKNILIEAITCIIEDIVHYRLEQTVIITLFGCYYQ